MVESYFINDKNFIKLSNIREEENCKPSTLNSHACALYAARCMYYVLSPIHITHVQRTNYKLQSYSMYYRD